MARPLPTSIVNVTHLNQGGNSIGSGRSSGSALGGGWMISQRPSKTPTATAPSDAKNHEPSATPPEPSRPELGSQKSSAPPPPRATSSVSQRSAALAGLGGAFGTSRRRAA